MQASNEWTQTIGSSKSSRGPNLRAQPDDQLTPRLFTLPILACLILAGGEQEKAEEEDEEEQFII